MLRFALLLMAPLTWAVPDYQAERDPPAPEAKKQFRLILRTPSRPCRSWHKVEPVLTKDDMLVSSGKKDEEGKGCRFLWVITPFETPGATQFVLEGFTGAKESFELPAPANYQPPKPSDNSHSPFMNVPGIADENGTGPANAVIKGKVSLPAGMGVSGTGPNPGTGK